MMATRSMSHHLRALPGGSVRSPSSFSKSQSTWAVYGVGSSPSSLRWGSTSSCACACMASWPMNPMTSSRSRSSRMYGSTCLYTCTNQRSPAGSSRCSTLMVCVANGSPGTQCNGVSSQENDTLRALRGIRSESTGWGSRARVLDMPSMY